jgi:hypothetical protein
MKSDPRHDELEQRLRAAAAFAPAPPARLRGRILEAVRALPTDADAPVGHRVVRRERWGGAFAAAAAALVLASAWWLARVTPERTGDARAVVALSQDLLGAGSRMLALPARAEAGLRLEAEKLLADTTRIAADVVQGLPAPLRPQRERM